VTNSLVKTAKVGCIIDKSRYYFGSVRTEPGHERVKCMCWRSDRIFSYGKAIRMIMIMNLFV